MLGRSLRQVLVTRPEPQASEWVQRLGELGVPAQALPLLHIGPAPDPEAIQNTFAGLAAGDLVMFVSPNAVLQFFSAISTGRMSASWPTDVWAACTGPGSAECLRSAGVPAERIVQPAPGDRLDSESLWKQLHLQSWSGRRAWIIRGEGGRDWLAQKLADAGGDVRLVQGYSRGTAIWDARQQIVAQHAASHPGKWVWLLSSGEAVDALPGLISGQDWAGAWAFATHPRILNKAQAIGFQHVTLISPDVDAVVGAWLALERG
jgi:uroporphyrinogen-III synthase